MTKNDTILYYFGARYYDSDLSSWLSVDPLAEARAWISPYNYSQNNPVGRKDPTGRLDDGYIRGKAAGEATAQLQEATPNLQIKRDEETGQLSYDGQAKTRAERKVAEVIDDDKITVNIIAENSATFTYMGRNYKTNGGSFLGNVIVNNADGSNSAHTFQYVNPEMFANDYKGNIGQGMLHEISESHIGGKISLRNGIPAGPAVHDVFNPIYDKAHNRALPQPAWKLAQKPAKAETTDDILKRINSFEAPKIKPLFK